MEEFMTKKYTVILEDGSIDFIGTRQDCFHYRKVRRYTGATVAPFVELIETEKPIIEVQPKENKSFFQRLFKK